MTASTSGKGVGWFSPGSRNSVRNFFTRKQEALDGLVMARQERTHHKNNQGNSLKKTCLCKGKNETIETRKKMDTSRISP